MVAEITPSKTIEAALNYNEKKNAEVKRSCLHATDYLSEAKNMKFYQKINISKIFRHYVDWIRAKLAGT